METLISVIVVIGCVWIIANLGAKNKRRVELFNEKAKEVTGNTLYRITHRNKDRQIEEMIRKLLEIQAEDQEQKREERKSRK